MSGAQAEHLYRQLTRAQRDTLYGGCCSMLSYTCICRSPERAALQLMGIARADGELTDMGRKVQDLVVETDE